MTQPSAKLAKKLSCNHPTEGACHPTVDTSHVTVISVVINALSSVVSDLPGHILPSISIL